MAEQGKNALNTVKVKLTKDCTHRGEEKKAGESVDVTSGEKLVMQSHGLVDKD